MSNIFHVNISNEVIYIILHIFDLIFVKKYVHHLKKVN